MVVDQAKAFARVAPAPLTRTVADAQNRQVPSP